MIDEEHRATRRREAPRRRAYATPAAETADARSRKVAPDRWRCLTARLSSSTPEPTAAHMSVLETAEPMPLNRWNDDRLDDLSRDVRRNSDRLDDFDNLRIELAELRKDIRSAGEEAHSCAAGLEALKIDLAKRAQIQHNERKADRRWMIGTGLVVAGLIISALAVFLG